MGVSWRKGSQHRPWWMGLSTSMQQHQPESAAGCWPRNTKAVNKAAAGAAMISVQPASQHCDSFLLHCDMQALVPLWHSTAVIAGHKGSELIGVQHPPGRNTLSVI